MTKQRAAIILALIDLTNVLDMLDFGNPPSLSLARKKIDRAIDTLEKSLTQH